MEQTERAKGPGYEVLAFREDDVLMELMQDFWAGRPVAWPVLEPITVHKVWEHFSRTGQVRDERTLDAIYASMRDNLCRLQIATIAAGHEAVDPGAHLGIEDEDELERFADWLIETPDGWRISDYGIKPLANALALAYEARTPQAKLKYLDRALHVTHMRGDLSRLFIRGGRESVLELSALEEEEAA